MTVENTFGNTPKYQMYYGKASGTTRVAIITNRISCNNFQNIYMHTRWLHFAQIRMHTRGSAYTTEKMYLWKFCIHVCTRYASV